MSLMKTILRSDFFMYQASRDALEKEPMGTAILTQFHPSFFTLLVRVPDGIGEFRIPAFTGKYPYKVPCDHEDSMSEFEVMLRNDPAPRHEKTPDKYVRVIHYLLIPPLNLFYIA